MTLQEATDYLRRLSALPFPLFVDLDGVLADFEHGFFLVTGMTTRLYTQRHGTPAFWRVIRTNRDFFRNLRPMPDGPDLWRAIRHLGPTILTGTHPGTGEQGYPQQKRDWCARYLGDTVPVITCMSADKPLHMGVPGAMLIDDRDKNCLEWSDAGGRAIQHVSALGTLQKLVAYVEAELARAA